MSTVLHGRRKGQNSGSQSIADLRRTTVLQKPEWERIQLQLNREAMEAEKKRQEREARDNLHQESLMQVKNWTNTVYGQRQKKLDERKGRELMEEEERKNIDFQEEMYKAQKRKEALAEAKQKQYNQTDRVKTFHSALLLTEVLKERDAQIELKRLMEKKNDGFDKDFQKKARQEHEEAKLRELEVARQKLNRNIDCANYQNMQICEHLRERDENMEENRIEAEELRRLRFEHELEKTRLAEMKAMEAKRLLADNLQQIDEVKKLRQMERQLQEDADEECRQFAGAKRKMLKMRATKERELHNERQAHLERLRSQLHKQIKEQIDDEDQRIAAAIRENDAKVAKDEAEKAQKRRDMFRSIAEYRELARQQKEHEEMEMKRAEREEEFDRMQADAAHRANEEGKQARRLENARNVASHHQNQIDERKTIRYNEREDNMTSMSDTLQKLGLEEKQFQEYAREVIADREQHGRNTYAMRRVAGMGRGPSYEATRGAVVRPSYLSSQQLQLPHYEQESSNMTKEVIYNNEASEKRLGFVW